MTCSFCRCCGRLLSAQPRHGNRLAGPLGVRALSAEMAAPPVAEERNAFALLGGEG